VRRGAASCRALLRTCPVTAAVSSPRAVMGCRAPQMRQPKRGLGAQPAVAVAVAVEDVRTPATPVVARSASSVRRAGVRPMVRRTSGVQTSGVQTSGVHATGVHATGAVRVSGRTRLRCPRPASALSEALDAECVGAVGSLRWAQQVRRAAVGPRAAWSPDRAEPARTGWSWAGVEARMRVDGRQRPGCGPRSPPGRQGSWFRARVPVGWLGSTSGTRCSPVPRGVLGKGAGVDVPPWTTQDQHQHDDHGAWSPSRSSPAPEGPSGSAGSRLRPQCGRGT
jgi:hypothetical protein